MDASEIYSKRLNAKEVIFPKEKRNYFSNRRWTNQNTWRRSGTENIHLGTASTNSKRESNIDFLGESEGSLPQPHDSLPDAGEAINDIWSMSGSFIFRHHVGPRVKLYSPRKESFPTPLKYIDVTRTTHTNLDVKQEKRIDDYWNIDGFRDLSDPWTGGQEDGVPKAGQKGVGGLARVPNLRVCELPSVTGCGTRRERRMT